DGDVSEYFLSGTFTADPAADHTPPGDGHVWRGTIVLPAVRLVSRRMRASRQIRLANAANSTRSAAASFGTVAHIWRGSSRSGGADRLVNHVGPLGEFALCDCDVA